jgi:hypothetical protein
VLSVEYQLSNGPHGVVYQKIVPFITATLRTSNPIRRAVSWTPKMFYVWNLIYFVVPCKISKFKINQF